MSGRDPALPLLGLPDRSGPLPFRWWRHYLRVGLEALWAEPRTVLAAMWWWLRGKRLRARTLFAPVIGRSPHAYDLWMARREPRLRFRTSEDVSSPLAHIVPVVRADDSDDASVADTLESLGTASASAIIVGGRPGDRTVTAFADVRERIERIQDPWLMPLRAGDRLAAGALEVYSHAVRSARAAVIYADDDLIDQSGQRHAPHFKADWNAELYRHFDFVSGSGVVRVPYATFELVGRASDWMERLFRDAAEFGGEHIPLILHHRRSRSTPSVAALVPRETASLPCVTAIIPSRNRLDLLRTCIKGLERTIYPDLEVIVVDNGSDEPQSLAYLDALDPARVTVLRHPGPFNYSAMINAGSAVARGQYLCLLNNDLEFTEPDWLRILVSRALEPGIGAVGGMLLYPDQSIQHAGIVLGVGGCAGHAHRGLRPEEEGYHWRHALPQLVSAVTGAVLVVERSKFNAVGGLNADELKVAFSDVDLCLRLNANGWRTLYEPRAMVVHHESASRGSERDKVSSVRLAREVAAFQRMWNTQTHRDPWHPPQLSRFSEQFVIAP